MQKISSDHKFNFRNQQILGSQELKGYAYLNMIEATFSFPEFVASYIKPVYFNYSFLRYIQLKSLVIRLTTPIFDNFHQKVIDQNSFFWIGINMQKIRLFHWFVLEISFFQTYCNLIATEYLAHVSGTRFLPNID